MSTPERPARTGCCQPGLRYRVLSLLLLPIWIIHAVWHGTRYRQWNYVLKRLGWQPNLKRCDIWIHGASVGEISLIEPLVKQLSQHHQMTVTAFTASGYQHARRIMAKGVQVGVIPIDYAPLTWIFVRRLKPRLALIAETELWPEVLAQIAHRNIPLLQINARLSAKTMRSSGYARRLLQNTLCCFDQHLARTQQDVDRLIELGAPATHVELCGNLKHAFSADDTEYPDLVGRPYLLLASTHSDEEFEFCQQCLPLNADLLTVIAPRHPQRSVGIVRQLESLGLQVGRRSQNHPVSGSTDIYLADTLGEMKALMQHARLVIMGGSFDATGGHNLIEPAQLGKAIITGPSDTNIREDIELLEASHALIQVCDWTELKKTLSELLTNPSKIQQLEENAQHCVSQQAHVMERYLQHIRPYL